MPQFPSLSYLENFEVLIQQLNLLNSELELKETELKEIRVNIRNQKNQELEKLEKQKRLAKNRVSSYQQRMQKKSDQNQIYHELEKRINGIVNEFLKTKFVSLIQRVSQKYSITKICGSHDLILQLVHNSSVLGLEGVEVVDFQDLDTVSFLRLRIFLEGGSIMILDQKYLVQHLIASLSESIK